MGFLMRKVHGGGPAEVIDGLGLKGIYEIAINIAENWESLGTLLQKYKNRPTSFADVGLIRCAEVFAELGYSRSTRIFVSIGGNELSDSRLCLESPGCLITPPNDMPLLECCTVRNTVRVWQ
jgi:hypothetical protein